MLFVIHAVLLVLASTNFSVISWLWGDFYWTFRYFEYGYRNGWGYNYVSDYALGQVLCYVGAYGLGVAVFRAAWLRRGLWTGVPAMILCLIGAASFIFELTHWLWSHHLSLIASFPAVMVVLWVVIGAQLWKNSHRNSLSTHPVKA